MSKATPRPWKCIDDGDGDIEITDLEQQFGACRVREDSNENRAMMKANAELIVRAVNCHDSMILFLENYLAGYISDTAMMPEARDLLNRAKG